MLSVFVSTDRKVVVSPDAMIAVRTGCATDLFTGAREFFMDVLINSTAVLFSGEFAVGTFGVVLVSDSNDFKNVVVTGAVVVPLCVSFGFDVVCIDRFGVVRPEIAVYFRQSFVVIDRLLATRWLKSYACQTRVPCNHSLE